MDEYDDYSTYNGDPVHDMWTDDLYRNSEVPSYNPSYNQPEPTFNNEVVEERPVIDRSKIPQHLQKYVSDDGTVDLGSLLSDCMKKCGL